MTTGPRQLLTSLYETAIAAAHPDRCLASLLPAPPARGRLVVLAAGKAAGSMARAAEAHYLDTLRLPPERMTGLAVARRGYGLPTRRIEMREAGHPVPDGAGLAAASDALALAAGADADDLVLVLLSGGASALWTLPAACVTLAGKRDVTRALLRSGAAIHEINTVRQRLSRIKAGRLAVAAHPAPLVTLAISDVAGDDPATIGSGPTVAAPCEARAASDVLARYGIAPPPAIAAALADPATLPPPPGHPAFRQTEYRLAATPAMALAAAAEHARALGLTPVIAGDALEGEARGLADAHARRARELAAAGQPTVFLSGGEATVTVRGKGRGGPNQEFALALALALDGNGGLWALAADTDGTDGGSGAPDDPAGAYVAPDTLTRARALGLDPVGALSANDSTPFFAALGDLLSTGPTWTNVNDFRAVLVDTSHGGDQGPRRGAGHTRNHCR